MRAVVSLLLWLVAGVALAAPAPMAKAPHGPFEIDFTPLGKAVAGNDTWEISIRITSARGKVNPVLTGVQAPDVDLTVFHLASTAFPHLDWAADRTGKKVIVKACHGKPPLSVEVSLEGLNKAFTPKVRRLPK
jgi:hypothetical protein